MFQKFNNEMNEINKKRTVLEQIIRKKDLEIEEKDQMLFEKISALEESERILSMRQAEIDSFEELLRVIDEKKEQLKNDLLKLDSQAIERKNINKDLKTETDFILRKKVLVEQGLEEMLGTMNNKFVDTRERRYKVDKEIKDHEDRLSELNQKISDSMNELVELQNSISSIKIEHEDHRGQIMKLAAMKKKLNDEIAKNQQLLKKYQKIREKLKIEQSLARGRKDMPDIHIELDDIPTAMKNRIRIIQKYLSCDNCNTRLTRDLFRSLFYCPLFIFTKYFNTDED
jgi:chromosome segregation ATPase